LTVDDAIRACRASGLSGWALVGFAQRFVHDHIAYSLTNSLDLPAAALRKGCGYCWQQAGVLHRILSGLGFQSRMVYATKARFPRTIIQGVDVPPRTSGHVWCRVRLDGQELDVCPGDAANRPGVVHFAVQSPVRRWNALISLATYPVSAATNARRRRSTRPQCAGAAGDEKMPQ